MKRRLILSAMALLIVFGCCCEVFADSRFTDNGDGTLTDTQTGLMWLKDLNCMKKKYSSDPQDTLEKTWQDALKRVADFNTNPGNYDCSGYTAAYNDWVLPNVNELETLVNTDIANPYVWLNGQGFSNVLAERYWTSTTYAADNLEAWYVNMNKGELQGDIKSTGKNYILPVRAQTQAAASLPVYKTGQKISFSAGDDGDLQRGIAWPSTRFTDNNDGTVTDNLTGLMWLKSADCFGNISWQTALDNITDFNANPGNYTCNAYIGNYTDWRLPTRREFRTLIDYSRNNPALPQDDPHPFTDVGYPHEHWTNTPIAGNTEHAWNIRTDSAAIGSKYKEYGSLVWPVRGSSIGPSMPIWDADGDKRWSLPDIVQGLKVLSGK